MSPFSTIRIEATGPVVMPTRVFVDGVEKKQITGFSLQFPADGFITMQVEQVVSPEGGAIEVENAVLAFDNLALSVEAEYQLYLHLRRKLDLDASVGGQ